MSTGGTSSPRSVVSCPACGTRNRVPLVSPGRPRCASCHADLPWSVDAGDAEFDAAASPGLVLVDLWAEWCGPCRMVAPVVAQLASEFAGRLKVVKVDVDAAPSVARRYDARSIPTLLLLRDGAIVERIVGAQPVHVLRDHVERALAAGSSR